jgi:formyltetrahydrofolate hydrolase
MESDVGALVRGPEPHALRSRPDERYADVGRLVITCPDRPGIVAAVSRLGRHVERAVLARAVGWHMEDRVIVHQNSTIVFS